MPSTARRAWLAVLLATAWNLPAAADPGADAVIPCFEVRDSDPNAAIALAERALALTGLSNQTIIKLEACISRAATHVGRIARAEAAIERVESGIEQEELPPEFLLRALSNTGAALHTMGRHQAALDHYVRAFEAAKRSDAEMAQSAMLSNVGTIHSESLGAYDEAEAYFARGVAIDARLGRYNPYLPLARAENMLRRGDLAGAHAQFAEAERLSQEREHELTLLRARSQRIWVEALRRERFDAATREALTGVAERQQAIGDQPGAVATRVLVSHALLRDGQAAQALDLARQARSQLPEGAFPIERREALRSELAALRALAQWQGALDASEALRELDARIVQRDGMDGLATLQAKLQDRQSEQELERLREERRIETLELEHADRLRNASFAALGALVLLVGAFVWYQRRVTARLRRLSTVDGLTGLLNRRAASGELQRGTGEPQDGPRRGVVFLIDIDHFKARNDRYGHAAGDTVLRSVARQLRASSRPGDVVARWGGEEFLVGCRALDPAGACAVAERLRAAIAALPPSGDGGEDPPLSVSIGFACHPFFPLGSGPDDWEDAVSLADRALYAAKHGGRNGWVGLWGEEDRVVPIAQVLADPGHHAAQGDLQVVASRTPVLWQPMSPQMEVAPA